jgi:hypothetical protein
MKNQRLWAYSIASALGILQLAGCPEKKEPPPTEPPILSAPLFRAPAGDEEAANAEELRASLRESGVGILSGSSAFPAEDWERVQAAYGTPRPADLRGRPAYFDPAQYRLTVYDWNQDRTRYVAVIDAQLPTELCTRRDSPYGFAAGWLTPRHIEVLSYCGDDPIYHRFVYDIETDSWSEPPQTWTAFFADDTGVYTYHDGLVTLPDGSTFQSSILNSNILSSHFVITYGGKLQNFRTGELFDLGAGLAANPSRTRGFVRSEGGFRIYNLADDRPELLLDYELPASASSTFSYPGWIDDDRWISAGRGYCLPSWYLPDCDSAPLLIDTQTGRVYEIDIAGGVPILFRVIR